MMGREKEIDLYSADEFELDFTEKSEDTIGDVLDERDYIRPLKEAGETSLDSLSLDGALEADDQGEDKIQMPPAENNVNKEDDRAEIDLEPLLEDSGQQNPEESSSSDSTENMPEETKMPVEDFLDIDGGDENEDDPPTEESAETDGRTDDVAADDEKQDAEELPDGIESGVDDLAEEKLPEELPEEEAANDFVGLDDDELEDSSIEEALPKPEKAPVKEKVEGKAEKASAKEDKDGEAPAENASEKKGTVEAIKKPASNPATNRSSSINKVTGFALIMMVIAAAVIYYHPSLIGFTRAGQPAPSEPADAIKPSIPASQPIVTPTGTGKRDQCLAKIEEASRLRNELLEKKNEIYELDLYYQNGIRELEEDIRVEIQKTGIDSYKAALKNKGVELKLRTIQRRRAYINELLKPAYWLNQGSEELFYLMRNAELDLQLTEIAGGIDLNKHMRHIGAAIQKYQPGPDKLAVDPLQAKAEPLEQIWDQILKNDGKKEKKQISMNPKDEIITEQICSGNFERISELSYISPRAAGCLSRMKGSDLFLNGLTVLTPDAAKQLFKWQGNWICLNGVKTLSPEAAEHLFKWKGNWISLNSLQEFPPELAKSLLKWEGQQLELMGFESGKNEANQETLKCLALWESTGGKLFVSDSVRKDMENLM